MSREDEWTHANGASYYRHRRDRDDGRHKKTTISAVQRALFSEAMMGVPEETMNPFNANV
jgi:hypothetical protein